MTSANPTLLVGLGAFGCRVIRRVAPPAEAPPAEPLDALVRAPDGRGAPPDAPEPGSVAAAPALDIIEVDGDALGGAPDQIAGRVTETARVASQRLLALGQFVATTAPTDARGPRLDVFVIGDLGEDGVAGCVAALVASLAHGLRAAFRPILGAGEGALAVCPMLVAPRHAAPAPMAAAIHTLAGLARHPDRARRPQARIYLVEDQSGKYLLPATELEHSFAAFLSLLLFSRLRDDSAARDLVEDTGDRGGPLATFACATLEIDTRALHRLCACRLARELLGHVDAGALALREIASEAHPLVPERTAIEGHLWMESGDRSLEAYLEPPRITVPDIDWHDEPEDIVDRKLGSLWRLEALRAIESFRDEVERFKMDRLARRIEENGTELMARVEAELMTRVRAEASAGPRGPERALEFARYAATRARGLMDEVQRAIDSPDLRELPEPPIDAGLTAIAHAAHAWPRHDPPRLRSFGAVAGVLSAMVIAALIHMALVIIGKPLPWLISAAAGAAVALPMTSYSLWRHRKRHHNWLVEARSDLDQAIEHHLRRDLVDYFRRRLLYTRALWTHRIYRQLADRLDAVVVQLEGGRAAVDEARARLSAMEHDLLQRHATTNRGGILYRSVLAADTVDAIYRHACPPDLVATAARYHAHATGQEDGQEDGKAASPPVDVLEAPYADPERVLAFARRELAPLSDLSPYQDSDAPLSGAVAGSVTRYLEQLALKLSPPLELVTSHAAGAPVPRALLVTPPDARALIERTLASANLDRGWDIRAVSEDARRVHLLLERGQLPVDAVAAAAPPAQTTPDGQLPAEIAAAPPAAAGSPGDAP